MLWNNDTDIEKSKGPTMRYDVSCEEPRRRERGKGAEEWRYGRNRSPLYFNGFYGVLNKNKNPIAGNNVQQLPCTIS